MQATWTQCRLPLDPGPGLVEVDRRRVAQQVADRRDEQPEDAAGLGHHGWASAPTETSMPSTSENSWAMRS